MDNAKYANIEAQMRAAQSKIYQAQTSLNEAASLLNQAKAHAGKSGKGGQDEGKGLALCDDMVQDSLTCVESAQIRLKEISKSLDY